MDTHTENIIKSILNVRCREGTTIADFEGTCYSRSYPFCVEGDWSDCFFISWLAISLILHSSSLNRLSFHLRKTDDVTMWLCDHVSTVEYFDLVGVPWPFAQCSPAEIASYLNSIADVHGVIAHNGQTKWYIRSARTQHLNKLIQSQRPERTKRVPRSMVFPPYPEPSNDICNTNDWYSVQRYTTIVRQWRRNLFIAR